MPGTVTVACKLPHGLVLRVFNMVEAQEPVMGGGFRKVKVAQERPERAEIKGWAHPQNHAPKAPLIGGFALTAGVDKDLWDTWKTQNAESDLVKNGLIFAHEKADSVQDQAKDQRALRSGLERLDPKKLPRGIEKSDLTPAQ
jgi:hypothetical protein